MGKANMRASDFATVRLSLGKFQVHSTADHIIGMQLIRKCDGVIFMAVATLYDDLAQKVETLLQAGVRDCRFQYGWDNRPSPEYSGIVLNARSEFRGNSGVVLRVEITAVSVIQLNNPKTEDLQAKNKTYENMSIADICKDVAEVEGWEVGTIAPTRMVPDPNRENQHRSFQRENETGYDFIKKKVAPYAVDQESKRKQMLRPEWGYDPKKQKVRFNLRPLGQIVGKSYDEFIVGGDDERVISWTPVMDYGIPNLVGAEELETQALDKVSNEKWKVRVYGEAANGTSVKCSRVFPASSDGKDAVSKLLIATWRKANSFWAKATLVITGDPQWRPLDMIEVKAYTKQGALHYSSGTYLIDDGEDNISAQGFITTLKLTKINPDSKDAEVKDSGASTTPVKVGTDTSPKSASVDPSDTAQQVTESTKGFEDYTFPVSTPQRGDLVVITKDVNGVPVKNIAYYVDSRYVKALTDEGSQYLTMDRFVQDSTVEYRRRV